MERKELEELKLEKEQIDKVMEMYGKEVGSFKEQIKTLNEEKETLSKDNASYKATVEELQKTDVDGLEKTIKNLQEEIKKNKEEREAEKADALFNDTLKGILKKNEVIDDKAVIAHLDIDSLKKSNNQNADIEKAIQTIKTDRKYLFKDNEPINNVNVGNTTTEAPADKEGISALRKAFGLKGDE